MLFVLVEARRIEIRIGMETDVVGPHIHDIEATRSRVEAIRQALGHTRPQVRLERRIVDVTY